MGEGDRKPSYQPNHKRVRCVRCGNAFVDVAVRRCRHPAVNRVYGAGGEAYVCCYCCGRCKHVTRSAHSSAVGCGYVV